MDEDERVRLQAHVNGRIISKLPHQAPESIVAIVIARPPSVHLLGTGTLFEVGGEQFVVTAAHVIKTAWRHTIGISSDSGFVATPGDWMVSMPRNDSLTDYLDVAVYKVPTRARERLLGKRFLRRSDLDFRELATRTVFSLCGFPGVFSAPSHGEGEKVLLRPLEYTTYASCKQQALPLPDFDSRYHLLLEGDPDDLSLPDGTPAIVRARDGTPASFPLALRGMSGCAVWAIGDLDLPVESWGPPRVVGIQTGVYTESKTVTAVRWIAVNTLLYEAFADLRPAIRLWTLDG